MAQAKQSLQVEQQHNPRYINEKQTPSVAKYVYVVRKAMNILDPSVNDTLTRDEVQALVDRGVNVTVDVFKK